MKKTSILWNDTESYVAFLYQEGSVNVLEYVIEKPEQYSCKIKKVIKSVDFNEYELLGIYDEKTERFTKAEGIC